MRRRNFCWIGEVFEDVAEITQSKEFVAAIKRRAEKVVDAEERRSVQVDVRYAEDSLFADEFVGLFPLFVVSKSSFSVYIFDVFDGRNFRSVRFLIRLEPEMIHCHEISLSFASQPQVQGTK